MSDSFSVLSSCSNHLQLLNFNTEMLSLSVCTFLCGFCHFLLCSTPTDTSNIFMWASRWFSRHLQLFMVNLKKYLVLRISSCKLWIPTEGPRYKYFVLKNVSLAILSLPPMGFLVFRGVLFLFSPSLYLFYLSSFSLRKLLEIFRRQSQNGELYYLGTSILLGLTRVVELVKIQRVSQTISCRTYSK